MQDELLQPLMDLMVERWAAPDPEVSPAAGDDADVAPRAAPAPADANFAEATLANATPAEATPAEAEATLAEATSAEATLADATPAEATPAEAEATFAEATLADATPAEANFAEAEATLAEAALADATSAEPALAERSPAEPAPAALATGDPEVDALIGPHDDVDFGADDSMSQEQLARALSVELHGRDPYHVEHADQAPAVACDAIVGPPAPEVVAEAATALQPATTAPAAEAKLFVPRLASTENLVEKRNRLKELARLVVSLHGHGRNNQTHAP